MTHREHFWRLEHLSDRQLLERLQGVLRTQRCSLAELVAHLGEVEERRLHLAAAYSSLFSYCVQHLGMSEDEACRRIELARLARTFPSLFGELARGRISLSVALLLKPVLTAENHAELIAAARGASLRTAREMLAVRFPSPDVPSRIRKLPGRRVVDVPAAGADVAGLMFAAVAGVSTTIPAGAAEVAKAMHAAAADVASAILVTEGSGRGGVGGPISALVTTPDVTTGTTLAPARPSSPPPPGAAEAELGAATAVHAQPVLQEPPASAEPSQASARAALLPGYPELRPRSDPGKCIDPLSAGRYRVQFTADASLKKKLELARDLLRHAYPSGDLAPIVSRAVDLLLQELLQRRFGACRKESPRRSARSGSHAAPTMPAAGTAPNASPQSSALQLGVPAPARSLAAPIVAASTAIVPSATTLCGAKPQASAPSLVASDAARVVTPPATVPATTTPTPHIPRAARRAVLERDGLRCCWVDAEGKSCGSTAWLEVDHRHPSGKGGGSEPENLRLLCRAHNRFAAERAYGRDHVERAIRARQRRVKGQPKSRQPPSPSPSPAPA